MSVVGFTFGNAANASLPTTASAASAATTASTRAGGFSRSYHAKPAATARASRASDDACQVIAGPPVERRARSSWRHLRSDAKQDARTVVGEQRRTARHARHLGREVAAAREHLVG